MGRAVLAESFQGVRKILARTRPIDDEVRGSAMGLAPHPGAAVLKQLDMPSEHQLTGAVNPASTFRGELGFCRGDHGVNGVAPRLLGRRQGVPSCAGDR
jgi:hypothetical protein